MILTRFVNPTDFNVIRGIILRMPFHPKDIGGIVVIYSPTCSYCTKFKNSVDSFKDYVKQGGAVYYLDGTNPANGPILKLFGYRGYPSMFKVDNLGYVDYRKEMLFDWQNPNLLKDNIISLY